MQKGLRLWNDEVAKTNRREDIYKQKRNRAKSLVKQIHDESQRQFVESTEHDIHGRQLVTYKMLKGMNKNENDTVNLNIIPKHKIIYHYKALWYKR